MLKIFLSATLFFCFTSIFLFLLSAYEKTHRNDEKTFDGIIEMCAWNVILMILFGIATLTTWIVWG